MNKRTQLAGCIMASAFLLTACGEDEKTTQTATPAEVGEAQLPTTEPAPAPAPVVEPEAAPEVEMVESPTTEAPAEAMAESGETYPEKLVESMDESAAEINQDIAELSEAVAEEEPVNGQEVYAGLCFSCHDTGLMDSPKLGDQAAWAPRVAQGKETLYQSAINGKNMMPPKGGNPALTDEQIKATVDYMISQLP